MTRYVVWSHPQSDFYTLAEESSEPPAGATVRAAFEAADWKEASEMALAIQRSDTAAEQARARDDSRAEDPGTLVSRSA